MQLNLDWQRKEYIVLAEIMPDEVNSYAGDFRNHPVESINGITIWILDDVYKAFKPARGGSGDFYIIKFLGINQSLSTKFKNSLMFSLSPVRETSSRDGSCDVLSKKLP